MSISELSKTATLEMYIAELALGGYVSWGVTGAYFVTRSEEVRIGDMLYPEEKKIYVGDDYLEILRPLLAPTGKWPVRHVLKETLPEWAEVVRARTLLEFR